MLKVLVKEWTPCEGGGGGFMLVIAAGAEDAVLHADCPEPEADGITC